MQKITVSDTSTLILFYKIDALEILKKVFGQITITQTVLKELNKPIPDWVNVAQPQSNLYKALLGFLDPGEASSIALALENKQALLIIDELKGRKTARELNIKITGALGILILAKKKGYIHSVKAIIDKILKTNFRISKKLIERTLIIADERIK